MTWRDDAACLGADTELFYPDKGNTDGLAGHCLGEPDDPQGGLW